MDTNERIERMHARARELRDKRNKQITALLGSASAVLAVALLTCCGYLMGNRHGYSASDLTGSSMLDAGVGGYVLVAVLAFGVGVVVTVVIRFLRMKSEQRGNDTDE